MRRVIAVAAMMMALASAAQAAPLDPLVTNGVWTDLGVDPKNDGARWFDNLSWDGKEEAMAWKHRTPGWKILTDPLTLNAGVGFAWDGALWDDYAWHTGQTDWPVQTFTHDGAAGFNFSNSMGRHINSHQGTGMLLLARFSITLIELEIWLEDIIYGENREDRDHNDLWARMTFALPSLPPPGEPFDFPGTPVPEPGTLALFGIGLTTIGRLARRRRA